MLLLMPCVGDAAGLELRAAGVQVRVGERTVLGQQSPESFHEYDLVGRFATPWQREGVAGLTVGAQLLASAGAFEGPGRTAAVASVVPLLAVGGSDRRFTLDGGAGFVLLSEHRYGKQDFGGPLQFALTLGLEVPLYRRLGIGYRFLHYSDAGMYGATTVGADLHMAALLYRF